MGGFSNALLDRIAGPGQAPVAQINPLDQQAKQQAIAESQQAQQLNAQKIQQQQIALNDQKAMTAAMQEWDGKDMNALPGLVIKHGASAGTVIGLKNSLIDQKTKLVTLGKDENDLQKDKNNQVAGAISTLIDPKQVPDEQLSDQIRATAKDLMDRGLLDPPHERAAEQLAQMPPPQARQQLDLIRKQRLGMSALNDEAAKQAEAAQNNAKAANEGAQAKLANIKVRLAENSKPGDFDADIDTVFPPNGLNTGGPNRMYKSLVNSALQRGDVEGARKYIDQASESQQAINKEIAVATNPQIQQGKVAVATAEGKARAAIQNGAPISIPAGATGEDALASLDPSTQAVVRMIGDGKSDFKTFTARSSPAYRAQLAAAVHAYNPDFNEATYAIAKKAGEAFTSGSQGQQLMAIGTAREHMKTFAKLAAALDTNDVQALNKIGQAFGVQFGSDKKTNFDLAAQAFGGEVGRAFDGAGVTAGEREKAEAGYKSAMSKGQFKGAIQTVDELLAGKQKSAKASYDAAQKGKPNFGGEQGGMKTLTMAAIQRAAKDHGVSVDEAKRQAIAAGYTIQ